MDDEGALASPSVQLHPVPYLRAVAHAVLEGEGEGTVVALAAKIGTYGAKLELLGVAVVLPRPMAPTPPWSTLSLQSFTVDFVRPNSCCSMVMVAPPAYLPAKRCLNSAE